MLTATRRMTRSPWMLAIALIVGVPAIADAQLFPNRNIKRQRPPCNQEPPFNAHVRRDYFGYYPTCWSKFPSGWGCPCPNPELPNVAAAFEARKRTTPAAGLEDSPDAMPGDTAPPAPDDMLNDPNVPPMPTRGRTPFNRDTPLPDPANPDGGRAPATSPPPATAPPASGPATGGLMELPRLPEPSTPSTTPTTTSAVDPGSLRFPSPEDEAVLTSNLGDNTGTGGLAMPDPRLGAAPTGEDSVADPSTTPAAKAPAARRSLISGLFSGARRRR